MIAEKIKIAEPVRGFTERDRNSKAILNTDMDSLLKYKIQKNILNLRKRCSICAINIWEKKTIAI